MSVIATAVSGRIAEKMGAIRLMVVCCILTDVGIVGFAFNASVVAALAITLVLAVTIDLFYPSTVALGMDYIPRHLGMASGLSYGVAVCVGGVAEPFLGLAGDAVGLVPVMLVLAAVPLASAVLGVVLKRLHRARFPM